MALVLGLTCLTSCSDFLNRQPTNSGNADEAIATQRDAEVAINGMMFKMSSSSYYGRNFLLYGDAKGGDLTIYTNGRGNDNLYTFNHERHLPGVLVADLRLHNAGQQPH